MGLSPLDTAATSGLLYKPQMIAEGDCGAIGGMTLLNLKFPMRSAQFGCAVVCDRDSWLQLYLPPH
jgi:hypothetical protein